MPDIFVPLDTTQFTSMHRQLAAKGIIVSANLRYVDECRKQLKKQYPDFPTFNGKFEIPQKVIDEIIAEGKKQNVTPKDNAELAATLLSLRIQLKALVARDLWDMTEYFQVMNEQNHIVMRAVDELMK